ncbi:MAG: MarR family transcriptional regulator [Acidimicrobiaceae bacterium]|nr:MarR family transcriptional regulator [Acidimicrobiaceae bacterium]
MTPRKRSEATDYPLWLMKRAFYHLHRAVNEAVWEYGITATQLGALNRLVERPGLSGAELGRRLLVTPQAAQLALTALEERGLVERKPDANHGRILRNFVTDEGRRVTRLGVSRALAVEERYLAVLDADEQAMLTDFLRRLAQVQPADSFAGDHREVGL